MKTAKRSNFTGFKINDKLIDTYVRDADFDIQTLFTIFKGRVRFGDGNDGQFGENISGQFQVIADTGSADTEFTVSHDIGAVPVGFIVVNIDKGGVVYDSGTAWTSSNVYLKCTTANTAVTIFLLK